MSPRVLFVFNRMFPPERGTEVKLYYDYLRSRYADTKMFCEQSACDDPNVIAGGTLSPSLFVREFAFCLNLVKYLVKHRKQIDIVYFLSPLLLCQPAIMAARLLGMKTIFDLRSGPITAMRWKYELLKLIDRTHLMLVHQIAGIDLKLLENSYGKCFARNAVELPEGFVAHVKPSAHCRQSPYKFILPTAVSKVRRIDEICRAFVGLTDCHLYIYGIGDSLESLKAEFSREENIHFMGYVVYDTMIEGMPSFDYGISYIPQTFYYEYQPPLKTIEYLGAGLPVIATGTHGNKVYVNETNGIIINDNEQELRAAILRITTMSFDRQKLHDDMMKYDWNTLLHDAFRRLGIISAEE